LSLNMLYILSLQESLKNVTQRTNQCVVVDIKQCNISVCYSSCCVNVYQCRPCTYDVISWRVRVMFVPPQLSKQPDTVSVEESAFVAILCLQQI
jgi:hypothetical protein